MTLTLRTTGAPTVIEDWSGSTQGGVEQNHNAFPGASELPNGNILICFQKAYTHGGVNGGIWYTIIRPDGTVVVAPTVLRHAGGTQSTPTMSAGLPTSLYWGFGDVSATLLSNGEVMVTWFERSSAETVTKVWGAWFNTALDPAGIGGTWGTPVEITGWQSSGTKNGIIYNVIESGGVVLAPEWQTDDSGGANPMVRCVQSADWGRTFTAKSTIGTGSSLDETEFAKFSDGQIVAFTRNDAAGGRIDRRVSSTGGGSWGAATVAIAGSGSWYGFTNRPVLLVMPDDELWLSSRALYGNSSGNSYHVFFRSSDRGVTFTGPFDPYTGIAPTPGLPDEITRGWCVAGAWAKLNTGGIAHIWGEAKTYSPGPPYDPERAQLLYRVVTALPSLTLAPSAAWAQNDHAITVTANVGVRTTVAATVVADTGGTVRFDGPQAGRFEVSADGSAWATTLVVGAGTTSIYLGVTPQAGDGTLTARLGIPF